MNAQRIRVRQVGGADLEAAVERLAGRFQVSGFAGSGYSLLTDEGSVGVFLGKAVEAWTADALFLMRQALSPAQVSVVAGWGVADPFETVRGLRFGHCLLLERI